MKNSKYIEFPAKVVAILILIMVVPLFYTVLLIEEFITELTSRLGKR